MYLNGMVPSYVHTLAVGSAVPMLGACHSLSMAAQTVQSSGLDTWAKSIRSRARLRASPWASWVAVLILVGGAGNAAVVIAVGAFAYGVYYGVTNVMTPSFARKTFGGLEYPIVYARIPWQRMLRAYARDFYGAP